MSATHGCNDNTAVVEKYKEALKQRLGEDIFRAWFTNGITFRFVSKELVAAEQVAAEHDSKEQAIEASSQDAQAKDTSQTDSQNQTSKSQLVGVNGRVVVTVRGQFALDRLRRKFIREMRGAAMQACGQGVNVELQLAAPPQQVDLPLDSLNESSVDNSSGDESTPQSNKRPTKPTKRRRQNQQTSKNPVQLSQLSFPNMPVAQSKKPKTSNQSTSDSRGGSNTSAAPEPTSEKPQQPTASLSTFIDGSCNHFALTAVKMVCETPGGSSPLFLCGPPGVGKTHLLTAIANYLRRGRRMRRVIHITAEKFTNDFIASVAGGNLTSFRARYRDLDALLIDDAQFLSSKKATLREMQYTIDGLTDRGKTLVFSGSHAPTEISGLTPELAGRMAAGFVCPMQSLDLTTRTDLLRQRISDSKQIEWPDEIVNEIASMVAGDGRRIQSIVNLVELLQRMYSRMPTMNEIRQHAGEQLRSGQITTLASIEDAVMKIFQLEDGTLKSRSQARTATEPRMLAMYLSRELTPAAYSEIGRHYGGRSHSAAMLAVTRVEQWLRTGKPVGRGQASFSARDALNRIESMLRSG